MTEQDAKQLISDILNHAQEDKQFEFKYICSWAEFRHYSKIIKSTKFVIKTLKTSADKLFKEYCQDVIIGISDVNKLLAYSQLVDVICFYEADINTIKKMIDEYDNYLGDWGNFFNALLGGEREL